jgi:hypothetical protein
MVIVLVSVGVIEGVGDGEGVTVERGKIIVLVSDGDDVTVERGTVGRMSLLHDTKINANNKVSRM